MPSLAEDLRADVPVAEDLLAEDLAADLLAQADRAPGDVLVGAVPAGAVPAAARARVDPGDLKGGLNHAHCRGRVSRADPEDAIHNGRAADRRPACGPGPLERIP